MVVYDTPSYIESAPLVVERSVDYLPVEPAPTYVPAQPAPEGVAAPSAIEEAGALLRQGDDAFKEGRFQEARRLYTEGLLLDDSNGFAHAAYMLPHLVAGEYEAAASALRRALTLEPMLIDQPLDTSAMFGDPADFDRYLSALRGHATSRPDDASALLLWSYLLYGRGDASGAAAALDGLIRGQPSDTLAHVLRDAVGRAQSGSPGSTQTAPPSA